MTLAPAPSEVLVRPFRPGDNAALCDAGRRLRVPARVGLGVDRGPDFTAFNRVLTERWDTLVAEVGGQPVAFLDMSYCFLRAGAESLPAAYVNLVGAMPGRAGGLTFGALVRAGRRRAVEQGAVVAVGLVNERNWRMRQLLTRLLPQSVWLGPLHVHCFVPMPCLMRTCRWPHHRIAHVDPVQLPSLCRDDCRTSSLTLDQGRAPLTTLLSRYALDGLLARDTNGRPVAGLVLCDTGALRRILAVRLGTPLRALGVGLEALKPFIGRMAPPRQGAPLKLGCLVHAMVGPDGAAALAELLSLMLSSARRMGYALVMLGLSRSDTANLAARGIARLVNVNVPVAIPLDERTRLFLSGRSGQELRLEYALS